MLFMLKKSSCGPELYHMDGSQPLHLSTSLFAPSTSCFPSTRVVDIVAQAVSAIALQPAKVGSVAIQPVCIAVATRHSRKVSRVSMLLLAASEGAAVVYGAASSLTAQIDVHTKLTVQVRKFPI